MQLSEATGWASSGRFADHIPGCLEGYGESGSDSGDSVGNGKIHFNAQQDSTGKHGYRVCRLKPPFLTAISEGTSCPTGYAMVTSKAECALALRSLKAQSAVRVSSSLRIGSFGNRVRGCSVSHREIYFNSRTLGVGKHGYLVCAIAKSPSIPAPPPPPPSPPSPPPLPPSQKIQRTCTYKLQQDQWWEGTALFGADPSDTANSWQGSLSQCQQKCERSTECIGISRHTKEVRPVSFKGNAGKARVASLGRVSAVCKIYQSDAFTIEAKGTTGDCSKSWNDVAEGGCHTPLFACAQGTWRFGQQCSNVLTPNIGVAAKSHATFDLRVTKNGKEFNMYSDGELVKTWHSQLKYTKCAPLNIGGNIGGGERFTGKISSLALCEGAHSDGCRSQSGYCWGWKTGGPWVDDTRYKSWSRSCSKRKPLSRTNQVAVNLANGSYVRVSQFKGVSVQLGPGLQPRTQQQAVAHT